VPASARALDPVRQAADSVLLVSMPWDALWLPSIQLGTLQSLLERAGIPTSVRSFKLDFMEHCVRATAGRPPDERLGPSDYRAIGAKYTRTGLPDWVFAVPPYLDTGSSDAAYFQSLRAEGLSARILATARAMRALVPAFLDDCVEAVLRAGPGMLGFTTTFSQNVPSLVLAKLVKARAPTLPIVLGGANCEGPMGAALHRAFPWVDVVVRGEAERVLPDLARDLLAGRPPRPQPGLCYREGTRSIAVESAPAAPVEMDDVPLPTFDEYFERLGKSSFAAEVVLDVALPYESARGCWWGAVSHCTFCGLNGLSMAFRSKSPDRVLSDLVELTARYGRLAIGVVDNIVDLRYLRDVLPRLRDGGHDLNLFVETKSNLKREHVQLLREAGAASVQPGIESLSTPILGLMRKGVTAFQNIRLLKWCAHYGVRPVWNVIYGFPREPAREYARMADVVPSLTHLDPPRLHRLVLDRFSPYHIDPARFGLEVTGPLPHYRLLYPADEATVGDLAYAFEYRHADGRDPERYVARLRAAIDAWQANRVIGYRSLRYRRGPGFLVIQDRRPNLEPADYSYGEREASIYLACEDGATAAEVWRGLAPRQRAGLRLRDVQEFLDEMVVRRLAYGEGGRYLSLALPARLPEPAQYWAKSIDPEP
jgi:ribosomal peptide maturation radical SAM protein 1